MAFHVPENYRSREAEKFLHDHAGIDWPEGGNNGLFIFPSPVPGRTIRAMASDGELWEHVSVSVERGKKFAMPVWEEMCKVKDLFWDDEDVVVQYHPKKSSYVNAQQQTLHLWRPIGLEIPTPDPKLVGGF